MAKLKQGAKRGDPKPKQPPDPHKLNPTVERQLLVWIKSGATIKDACEAAGVTGPAVTYWRRMALADPNSVYGLFITRLEEAQAKAKVAAISAIHKNKDWRAKAHWLSRRYPLEWGNQPQEVKITHDDRPYKEKTEAELDAIEAQANAAEAAYAAQLATYASAQSGEVAGDAGASDPGEGPA